MIEAVTSQATPHSPPAPAHALSLSLFELEAEASLVFPNFSYLNYDVSGSEKEDT